MKEDESKTKKMVNPVVQALQSLLKQRITSADNVGKEIQRVANVIKRKPETIQSLIYGNKGSLGLRVAVLMTAFHLKNDEVQDFFRNLEVYLNKITPMKQSDKNWAELDSILSEKEKCYWTEAIKVLKRLEQKLKKDS